MNNAPPANAPGGARYPRYGKESRPVDRMRDSMAGHVMTG
jgi:hypothetical protein